MEENTIQFGSKTYKTSGGFLCEFDSWDEDYSRGVAEQHSITPDRDHRVVIRILREYYLEFGSLPPDIAVKKLYAKETGISRDEAARKIKELFPGGGIPLARKIAGLPGPKHCCL